MRKRRNKKKSLSKKAKNAIEKQLSMQCSPKCNFFPDMTCERFVYDKNNIKRRADGKKFICAFDGHEIKSWYDKCPLK